MHRTLLTLAELNKTSPRSLAPRVTCGALLWLMVSLAGCSTTPVVAPSKFPTPIVRPIPITVGLYLDDTVRNYVHVDKPARGPSQEVHVGNASEALFKEFLAAQFQNVVVLKSPQDRKRPPAQVQVILEPVIEDVQIASPKASKDEFHEAWIKYRLNMLTPQGQRITGWSLPAYGKHRGPAIGGGNASLTSAVREAMRDAAAGMAMIFRDGPAIQRRVGGASTAPRKTAGPS